MTRRSPAISAKVGADRSRSFVEGVSRRRRSDTKPRSECDDGIWLGVPVTFYRKCNIPLASHRDFLPYPCGATHLAFARSLRSTRKSSTTKSRCDFFAQNDIQNFYFVIIVRTDDRWSPLSRNKNARG